MSTLNCYTVESLAIAPDRYYGRFVLGQFAPGQGLTVANSLRRSLLTELTGCKFAFVYIPGARYEYENLPGLKETVLDILLNLKRVRLSSSLGAHPPIVSDLTVVGPSAVTGRDLNLPPFITVVNPDQPIVTVTETRTLVLRLVIVSGRGRDRAPMHDRRYRDYVRLTRSERGRGRWMLDVDSGLARTPTLKRSWSPRRTRRAAMVWRRVTDGKRRVYGADRVRRSRRSKGVIANVRMKRANVRLKRRFRRTVASGRRKKVRVTVSPTAKPPYRRDSARTRRRLRAHRRLRYAIANPMSRLHPPPVSFDSDRSGHFPLHYDVGPVTAVNYTIEAPTDNGERVGLEIWTDGSLEPARALGYAVRAMIQLFLPLQSRSARALARVSGDRDRYRRRLKLAQGALRLGAVAVRRHRAVWSRGSSRHPSKQNRLRTLRAYDQLGRRYGATARRTAKHNAQLRRAADRGRRKDHRAMHQRRRWFYDHRRLLKGLVRVERWSRQVYVRWKRRPKFRPLPRRRDDLVRERRYLYASRLVRRWRWSRRYPSSLAMHVDNLVLSARTASALSLAGLTDVGQLFVPDSVLQARYALPVAVVESVFTSLIRHVAVMILNHRDRPDATLRQIAKRGKPGRGKPGRGKPGRGKPGRGKPGRGKPR